MTKFYDTKLYQAKKGTIFIIIAEDYEHHHGYTEYCIRIIIDKGDFGPRIMNYNSEFWIRSGDLLGKEVRIIGDGEAIKILYGAKKS